MSWNEIHLSEGSVQPSIDSGTLQLYAMRLCPFAERAILVLLHKQVPFTLTFINLKSKPSWFLDTTNGKVPVLLTKGHTIHGSDIVSDYLDEAYEVNKLHPSDPVQRALDREVVDNHGAMMSNLYQIYGEIAGKTNEERLDNFSNLLRIVGGLEKELNKRGSLFLGGDNPCMSDYMIWPFYERLQALPKIRPDIGTKLELPQDLVRVKEWLGAMRNTGPVTQYGLSPARLAKALTVSNVTGDTDRAMRESEGL
eukprot:sb/3468658/